VNELTLSIVSITVHVATCIVAERELTNTHQKQ